MRRGAEGFQLAGWRLGKGHRLTADRPLFSEVALPAGIARVLPRLGEEGNRRFYWRGAAVADVDGDGAPDIFCSDHDRNQLYLNEGGSFVERSTELGLDALPVGATSPLFFDHDGDGDLDLFCAFVGWIEDGAPGGHSLRYFAREGDRFIDRSREVGLDEIRVPAFGAAAADFDGDGKLDLFVSVYERLDALYPDSWFDAANGRPNLLLMNRDGRFVDEATERGMTATRWTFAAAAADFDEDGDQDIYVANDYGPNELLINDGKGRFRDEAEARGVRDVGNGMGAAWADLDQDGRLDLYVSNMSSSAGNRILKRLGGEGSEVGATLLKLAAGNSIFFQREGGSFEAQPAAKGGLGASWAWSPALLDIDLDGLLDVYVANGFISGESAKDT